MEISGFDPITTKISRGTTLIEASAGTGKTYTIAMLALRMVVELDIPIQQILVVTFTKAATEELKNRIRLRLAEARAMLFSENAEGDERLRQWLAKLELPRDAVRNRLTAALLDIDQAGIFTIHGFCQRVLSEHALASGQLFQVELTDDLNAIQQAYADDFWRKEIQNRPAWEMAVLTKDFKSPDELLEGLKSVKAKAVIYPELIELDAELGKLKTAAKASAAPLEQAINAVLPHLDGFFSSGFKQNFEQNCALLGNWLNGTSLQIPPDEALSLFSRKTLIEALNGHRFKSRKDQAGNERKEEFLAELNIDTGPFDQVVIAARNVAIALRKKLLQGLLQDLDRQLETLNLWSFDSLITVLAEAVQADRDGHLSGEIRQCFSAALIDEFQDTDPNQWAIFSTLFASGHYLVLVGDPKQAIYKFRGADIHSYLAAQKQAENRFTLKHNWRSHPRLVEGVNLLFSRENAFWFRDIRFYPSEAGKKECEGAIFNNGQASAPLVLWQLAESSENNGWWNPEHNKAAELIKTAVVNETLKLLTANYFKQPGDLPLKPQDIAILVRTNKQARSYQESLALAGVPSVLASTESVYLSEEANQLFVLLDAVAHPGDLNRLIQALALDWFGHQGQSLYQLLNSQTELDKTVSNFALYFQLWQQKDLMAMMRLICQQENLTGTMASLPFADRRLTNFQHLLELLQEAILEERLGITKTLKWLKNAIMNNESRSAENQQLRLENDAAAVRIITMHRAKGLEFPVVFCPLLWAKDKSRNNKQGLAQCHAPEHNQWLIDLGSDDYEKHQAQAEFEQKAEEARLAYVALTRAKYRCYVAWADARSKNSPNQSALAALLDLSGKDFSEQKAYFQNLALNNPKCFSYCLLEREQVISGSYCPPAEMYRLKAESLQRLLHTHWQMNSYTALSTLSLSEAPELPPDIADETAFAADYSGLLPPGPQTGNAIHELLELIPFQELANKTDNRKRRDSVLQRYGLRLADPGIVDELLCTVVSTALSESDSSFTLANIPDRSCLKEMPFYLAVNSFGTSQINRILKDEAVFQPLTHKQMSGFLTGFIDLICEYKGAYYLMDYKTNHLPGYGAEHLIEAMREHNYGLQYWLYSVVLHQYLKLRLKGYNYQIHFGGVRYLFVRGMDKNISLSGVYRSKPSLEKLDTLARLFHA